MTTYVNVSPGGNSSTTQLQTPDIFFSLLAKACPSKISWIFHVVLPTSALAFCFGLYTARSLPIGYVTTLIYSLLVMSFIAHVEVVTSYSMSLKLFSCPEPFIKWKICTNETLLFSPHLQPTQFFSLSLFFFSSLRMQATFSSLSICIREKKSKSLCSTNLPLTNFLKLSQYRNPTNANLSYLLTAYADRSFQWHSISSPPNPPKIVWESHFQAALLLHINPPCCHISTLTVNTNIPEQSFHLPLP